jgi:hypothetical protein
MADWARAAGAKAMMRPRKCMLTISDDLIAGADQKQKVSGAEELIEVLYS